MIEVKKVNPLDYEADLLVVPMIEGVKKLTGTVAMVDNALGGIIKTIIQDEGFEGKNRETLIVQPHGSIPAKRVLVVGLGKKSNLTFNTVREASALVIKKARALKTKSIATTLYEIFSQTKLSARETASAVTEGVLLGDYQFLNYRGKEATNEAKKRKIESVVLVTGKSVNVKALKSGVDSGLLSAEATIFARDLVNTPSADMTPRHLVEVAKNIARQSKNIKVQIFDKKEARKLGMGSFLGVARGSDEPPYFIHLSYKPKGKKTRKVFLAGKGITFDTGGISLKPAAALERWPMKIDMAGGATVLGVFSKLGELKPKVEVHGVIPCTENMPSGKALKPHDVLKAMNGKTIEVINTDAEGRLVLADALSFAVKEKADYIIDLATLTGACVVALGGSYAGLFGNNAGLAKKVKEAAKISGEKFWELPLPAEYRQQLKSKVADMSNIGVSHEGDAIIGGIFLKEFVDKTPWVHLDIAGPAWAEQENNPSVPVGGTGFGVRTLLAFLGLVR